MAHPCDYYEKQTFSGTRSKLNKSPSTMNRVQSSSTKSTKSSSSTTRMFDSLKVDYIVVENKMVKNITNISEMRKSYSYTLSANFIRANETWAISSAYDYCLKYYSEFGLTKEIFALAMSDYIMSK